MMKVLQRTCRALVAATVVSMAVTYFDGSFLTWHAVLMSTAYIGLMTEGVLRAIGFRSLEGPQRVDAIRVHAVLQMVCSLLAGGGFWAMYQREVVRGKRHFRNLHSKLGLATLVSTVVLLVLGSVSFKRLGLLRHLPPQWQPTVKFLHRKFGLLVWMLAMTAIMLIMTARSVSQGILSRVWQGSLLITMILVLALSGLPQQPQSNNLPSVSVSGGRLYRV